MTRPLGYSGYVPYWKTVPLPAGRSLDDKALRGLMAGGGFGYAVFYGELVSVNHTVPEEVLQWCTANLTGEFTYVYRSTEDNSDLRVMFFFRSLSDGTFFKLRWG